MAVAGMIERDGIELPMAWGGRFLFAIIPQTNDVTRL
jgi:hypothetical protein